MDKRREEEFANLKKLDRKELYFGERYYYIYAPWLNKLLCFLRRETDEIPGPIDNSNLLCPHFSNSLRSGATEIDYKKIVPPVWNYLHSIYEGGPEVR